MGRDNEISRSYPEIVKQTCPKINHQRTRQPNPYSLIFRYRVRSDRPIAAITAQTGARHVVWSPLESCAPGDAWQKAFGSTRFTPVATDGARPCSACMTSMSMTLGKAV